MNILDVPAVKVIVTFPEFFQNFLRPLDYSIGTGDCRVSKIDAIELAHRTKTEQGIASCRKLLG